MKHLSQSSFVVLLSNLLLLFEVFNKTVYVRLADNDDSRRVINEIWTGTPRTAVSDRRGGTITRRVIFPKDSDLAHSGDEDADAEYDDDDDASGVLWDDPDFLTPSSIKLHLKTFTGIEWIRPPVVYFSL